MCNINNISDGSVDSHRLAVIGTGGNIVWEPNHNGPATMEGDTIVVKNSTGNLQEAYRLRPGEQVIIAESAGLLFGTEVGN